MLSTLRWINIILVTLALKLVATSILNQVDQNFAQLNILVNSGFGGKSHIKSMLEITNLLAIEGHQVTYAAIESNLDFLSNYPAIKGYNLGSFPMDKEKAKHIFLDLIEREGRGSTYMKPLNELIIPILANSFNQTYLPLKQKVIQDKPDIMICDFFSIACTGLAKQLSIPLVVGLQSTGTFNIISDTFFNENLYYSPLTTESMSLLERFHSKVIQPLINWEYNSNMLKILNQVRKEAGQSDEDNLFYDSNYALFLANTYTGYEPALYLPPNIKQIGPILSKSNQILTKDLTVFLEEHTKVLYIAFGSNSVLSSNLIKNILEGCLFALEDRSIDGIIWGLAKSDPNDFPSTLSTPSGEIVSTKELLAANPKIKLLPWAPQVPLLNHPSVKIFLNHGGLESTFESLSSGTPMLILGLFGDQLKAGRKVEEMGIGRFVNKKTFTSLSLSHDIKEVVKDVTGSFKLSLEKHKLISDTNQATTKGAQLIINHAKLAGICRPKEPYNSKSKVPCELRHLIPKAAHMSTIKRYNLDVYLLGLIAALFLIISVFAVFSSLLKFIIKLNEQASLKKKLN